MATAYFVIARGNMRFSDLPAHVGFVWLPRASRSQRCCWWDKARARGRARCLRRPVQCGRRPVVDSAVFAVGNTASAAAGAWLMDRKLAFSPALDHPHHLFLIGIGAFLSPVVAASIGALGTC